MDLGKTIKSIGNNLIKAKNLSTDLAIAKAKNTKISKSGSGLHTPGSFGVSAEVGAPEASMRMAGGIGLQKVAAHLIHTGVNKFVMPQVEKQMQGLAQKIKTDLNNKQHLSKGGTFARKPSVSM